jgi:hypothetical protein
MITTNVRLNEIAFLRKIAGDVKSDIEDGYDGYGNLLDDDAHSALQRIKGRMETLHSFLNALEQPEVPVGEVK